MEAERDLNAEERAIATRVCYAYQSKGTTLRMSYYLAGTFNFSITSRSCSDQKLDYLMKAKLYQDGNNLVFEPVNSSMPFEGDIQSSSSGLLTQLCNKIQNNRAISNTSSSSSTSKVQIRFYKDTLDAYALQYFSLKEGKMVSVGAETYRVRTQINMVSGSGQILGMDETYASYRPCSDGKTHSEHFQYFTGFKAN
jgi:hypothetical protein